MCWTGTDSAVSVALTQGPVEEAVRSVASVTTPSDRPHPAPPTDEILRLGMAVADMATSTSGGNPLPSAVADDLGDSQFTWRQ